MDEKEIRKELWEIALRFPTLAGLLEKEMGKNKTKVGTIWVQTIKDHNLDRDHFSNVCYAYAMAEKKLPEPQDQLIYAIVEEVKSLMAKDKLKWEQHVEVHSRKKYQQTKEDLWYRAMHWIYANNPSDEQVEELLSWTNRGGAKPKWVEEDTSGYW